jgi:glycosyltransferase involved in cell wall biosynthesis
MEVARISDSRGRMIVSAKKKICLIASAQYFVEVFWIDQIRKLSSQYDVTLLVKTTDPGFLSRYGININVISVPIERRLHLVGDLWAFLRLIVIFRRNSYDLVHSTGPKAALLAPVAGAVAGVPIRVHTFTGQVWAGRSGVMKWILKKADRFGAWAATHILVDSFSQRDFLLQEHIVSAAKSGVIAKGSFNGVNIDLFKPSATLRAKVRLAYSIGPDDFVFLYMARLTRDKGALVMAEAFARFCASNGPVAHLLVVGPDEETIRPTMRELCSSHLGRVHFVEYSLEPEQFMAAADALCLPSYREGFGSVLINAAAVGIPAIASRIYGSEEAVQEGVTGLLHEVGNAVELAEKMTLLYRDPALRERLGASGRARVERDFSEAKVTAAVLDFYEGLLA